jgi:hypothetical protein
MSIEISEAKRPGMLFWLWWVLASVGGVIVFMILSDSLSMIRARIVPQSSDQTYQQVTLFESIASGVLGALVGLAQWLVLRQVKPGTHFWVLATIVGYVLCSEMLLIFQFGRSILYFDTLTFLKIGIVLGIVQWIVLRKWVYQASWWIVTSFLSWLFAFSIIYVENLAGVATILQPWTPLTVLFVPIFVSGGGMLWLLQQRGPAEPRYWGRRIAIGLAVIIICAAVGAGLGVNWGEQQINKVDPWQPLGKPPQPATKILLLDRSGLYVQTTTSQIYRCCWSPAQLPTIPEFEKECPLSKFQPPSSPAPIVDRFETAQLIEGCEHKVYAVLDDGSVWWWNYSSSWLKLFIPTVNGVIGCVGGAIVGLFSVFLFFALRSLLQGFAH